MANYIERSNFSGNKKGGIYNAGKNTKIIGSDFVDQDIGIINVGENMHAKGNTFRKSLNNKVENFWMKWWMKYIVYPLIVTLIAGISLKYLF